MEQYISYIITSILGVILGSTITMVSKYIKGEKSEREAIKCLLRANIVSQYYVYRELGHIPFYVKESITKEFEAYKNLGGNSFVKQLVEEIQNWKVDK